MLNPQMKPNLTLHFTTLPCSTDGLREALAGAQKKLLLSGSHALASATGRAHSSDRTARPTSKSKLRKALTSSRRRKSSSLASPGRAKEDRRVTSLLKAVRYVRGVGAGAIHPSAKLKLFGLLMQAQYGDIPKGAEEEDAKAVAAATEKVRGLRDSALKLQHLKMRAWLAEKGKERDEAAEAYVQFLTSMAPTWKVANLLGRSLKDDEPKNMVWVLKLRVREVEGSYETVGSFKVPSTLVPSLGTNRTMIARALALRATHVEVIQASVGTSSGMFTEKAVATPDEREERRAGADVEGDPFVKRMPTDLTLDDCIIDKSEHGTIEEQRSYYAKEMLSMARLSEGEGGWQFLCKTTATSRMYVFFPVCERYQELAAHDTLQFLRPETIDVLSRNVSWSTQPQYRSASDTLVDLDSLFAYIRDGLVRKTTAHDTVNKYFKATRWGVARESMRHYHNLFTEKGDDSSTTIIYREFRFPWPITSRDAILVADCRFRAQREKSPPLF